MSPTPGGRIFGNKNAARGKQTILTGPDIHQQINNFNDQGRPGSSRASASLVGDQNVQRLCGLVRITRKRTVVVVSVIAAVVVLVAILVPVFVTRKDKSSGTSWATGEWPTGGPSGGGWVWSRPATSTSNAVTQTSTSAANSATAATTATQQSAPSSVSTATPPHPTADGLYLLNFKSTDGESIEGSGLGWYRVMNLTANLNKQPDDYTVISNNGYTQWEGNERTGLFIDTNTTFTANINMSSDTIASMPINAVVGTGWNANATSGETLRNFRVYKNTNDKFFQNDSNHLEYFAPYYAA